MRSRALPLLPTFTAIVAAWNEESNLNRHILSFKSLERSDCELIISAGGTDGSYAIAKSFAGPNIKVLEQLPGEGKQRALQNCLESASHELLYFTDADCDFDARAISYYLRSAPIADHSSDHGRLSPSPSADRELLRSVPSM